MSDPADFAQPANSPAAPTPPTPLLTPLACLAGVFFRPTRVFDSLARRPTWWVPFLLTMAVFFLFYFGSLAHFDTHQAFQKALQHPNPQAWQFTSMPPGQRAKLETTIQRIVRYSWIGGPLLILLYRAIEAALLLSIFRLAFHADINFRQMNAVVWHSSLPDLISFLPLAVKPFFGHALDSVQFKNLGYADLGYYFNPATTPRALYAVVSSINLCTVWSILLLAIGLVLVAHTKRIHGVIAALLWWIARWIVILMLFILVSMVAVAF